MSETTHFASYFQWSGISSRQQVESILHKLQIRFTRLFSITAFIFFSRKIIWTKIKFYIYMYLFNALRHCEWYHDRLPLRDVPFTKHCCFGYIKPKFGICFDIDGVLARGTEVLDAALKAFKKLVNSENQVQVPVVFVTNALNRNIDKAMQISNWLGINVRIMRTYIVATIAWKYPAIDFCLPTKSKSTLMVSHSII